MNQDNNAQSNPEETVVVEEAAEAVEAVGVNPDGDSKTAPVLEKQDIETTEKVSYGYLTGQSRKCRILMQIYLKTHAFLGYPYYP